ncbi:hypothetical protein F52700_6237 [Fusarium sp. NRRL 52700]|nr:hypothetical protein F52700_6237 [Fusarium sp. NRRL 52700]
MTSPAAPCSQPSPPEPPLFETGTNPGVSAPIPLIPRGKKPRSTTAPGHDVAAEEYKMFITLVFGVSIFGASTFAVAIGQMTDPADIWKPKKPPFSMETVRGFLGGAWLCFILAIAVAGFSSSLLTLLKNQHTIVGADGQKKWKTIAIATSVVLWTLLALAFLFLSLAMVPYAYVPGWIAVASVILFGIGMACLLFFQIRAHFQDNNV